MIQYARSASARYKAYLEDIRQKDQAVAKLTELQREEEKKKKKGN